MNTDEFFAEAKRLNLRVLGTPEETRAALDAKDAEIARMTGMSEALQAEWDRECGDADTILHALGLDPANCRTDGGSLKVQMIIGALAHRDVMLKRDAEQPLRIAIARAVPAMHSYASKNPKHEMNGALQDPCGVHAWLAEFGA